MYVLQKIPCKHNQLKSIKNNFKNDLKSVILIKLSYNLEGPFLLTVVLQQEKR